MKELRMEHTEGFGGEAEVWVDGALFKVFDSFSTHDERTQPGLLEGATLRYHNDESYTWDEALKGNRSHRSCIDPVKSWRYIGYGRVEQVMPVIINFGGIRMEDPNWSIDDGLVGKFVRVPINRLELARMEKQDWPEWEKK